MSRVRFEIEPESSGVSLQTYTIATSKLIQLLRELDSAISGKYGGMVNWYVVDLGKNGTFTLTIESQIKKPPRKRQVIQFRDTAPAVAQSFITGFENLQLRGTSPPYLSEYGLEKLQGMMQLMQKDGAKSFIATYVDDDRSVSITEKAAQTLHDLLPPKRKEYGSVEGTLETISIHGSKKFIIYESISRKGVTCILPEEGSIDKVKEGLGKKIIVYGDIQFNIKDEPVRVEIKDINELHILGFGKRLPTVDELTGSDPDFTGNESTDEYINRIRRG